MQLACCVILCRYANLFICFLFLSFQFASANNWLCSKICYVECPEGTFGVDCRHHCQCHNGARCDHVGGACICAAGWRGMSCDRLCPHGYYGVECRRTCLCDRRRQCHPVSGRCVCPPGFGGQNCTDVCPSGTWAHDCNEVTLGSWLLSDFPKVIAF